MSVLGSVFLPFFFFFILTNFFLMTNIVNINMCKNNSFCTC